MYENINKSREMLLECMETLNESCFKVGGALPDLEMSLRQFILTYGSNGVIFTVSNLVKKEGSE